MRRGLVLVAVSAFGGIAFSILTAPSNEAAQSPATVTVFTANTNSASVSFVDGDAMAQASPTANVGSSPNAVAVNPDGTRVAVTLRNSAAVQVTDTDGTNPKTIDMSGGTLADLVWSPDGTRLYVTRQSAGSISILDAVGNGGELDTIPLLMVGSTAPSPNPTAIGISANGTQLYVLVANEGFLRQVDIGTKSIVDSATVDIGSTGIAVSPDGSRVVVVGPGPARFLDTNGLDLINPGADDLGDQFSVAVAGTHAYVLNRQTLPSPTAKPHGKPRSSTAPTDTGIDVYAVATGAYERTIGFVSTATLYGVAVTPDEATAFVTTSGSEENGLLTRYDVASGASTGSLSVGNLPQDIAVYAKPPEQDVVSYFLPRKVKLTLKPGEGKDALIASGFYDDGGATLDFAEDVTVRIGTFERSFRLTANKKGDKFVSSDAVVKMVVVPNLKGSSRGRFRLTASKTTLAGLIPEDGPVEFHFSGSGVPDAVGRVSVTDGAYKLGGKRGTLEAPVFFAAFVKAKLGGDGADTLKFVGGFATGGTTPANIGTVRFGFGDFGPITFPPLTRKRDVYSGTSQDGNAKVKITIDFLRETVTIDAKGIELGALDAPTTIVTFLPGTGAAPATNTIRLGGTGAKRNY